MKNKDRMNYIAFLKIIFWGIITAFMFMWLGRKGVLIVIAFIAFVNIMVESGKLKK